MTDASTAPILQTQITNEPVRQLSLGGRIATFLGIIVPFSGVVTAGVLLWGWGFYWSDLVLMLGMYLLTLSGITVGYHRLFVHRSFETSTWVKFIFGVLGSMALQGNLLKWVALHRRHHQHSDTHDDVQAPAPGRESTTQCDDDRRAQSAARRNSGEFIAGLRGGIAGRADKRCHRRRTLAQVTGWRSRGMPWAYGRQTGS